MIGVCLGAAQVGAQTYRIVQTLVGERVKVLLASVVLAVAYWLSINLVVQQDLIGYIGFAFGAGMVSVLMAHKNAVHDKLDHLEHPEE